MGREESGDRPVRPRPGDPNLLHLEARRILVMQSGGWLGDMVLLTPGLRALREHWPDAEIALLVRPLAAPIMRGHPCIDRLLVYDKRGQDRGMRPLLDWSRRLRGHNLAVVWHPTSLRSALLAWAARIPVRVGTNVSGRGIFLTHPTPQHPELHEVERYLSVLEPLGIQVAGPTLEYWHRDEHRQRVYEWLAMQSFDLSRPLLAVHLGTTWPTKRWPMERFAAVIEQIESSGLAQVILVGGPDLQKLAVEFQSQLQALCITAVGKWDLLEFGALLESVAGLLTCDSGPMHIAAAVGTPTVALFGPTSPQRHAPHGQGHRVIWNRVHCAPCYRRECPYAHECMLGIQVPEVVEAVGALISGD